MATQKKSSRLVLATGVLAVAGIAVSTVGSIIGAGAAGGTTAAPTAGICAAQTYEWSGFSKIHRDATTFDYGITIPPAGPGETLTVQSLAVSSYDGYNALIHGSLTRATQDQPNERYGIRIGNVDVNAITDDLPDTMAEGAVTDLYSGIWGYNLPQWAGVAIDGGGAVIARHSSLPPYNVPAWNTGDPMESERYPGSLTPAGIKLVVQRCSASTATPPTVRTNTAGDGGTTPPPITITPTTAPPVTTVPVTTTPVTNPASLRDVATARGFLIGAAVNSAMLGDPAYQAAIAANFNSITPENELKMDWVHPSATTWNFTQADAIVDFATQHGLQVRGHTLVWGQQWSGGRPQWIDNLTDPVALRAEIADTITTTVSRYRGRISRWDVVNEPFDVGTGQLNPNDIFTQRLGSGYIKWAFDLAHAADPAAELWLNEGLTEYVPAKADALVELVRSLKAAGAPIDGVGLQTHLFLGDTAPGTLSSMVTRLKALGVKVAITEMDIPNGANSATGAVRTPAATAALYGRYATELIAAGGSELTVWGVSDAMTWLDSAQMRQYNAIVRSWPNPSSPLLLDANYQPKAAYQSVLTAVAAKAPTSVATPQVVSGGPTTTVATTVEPTTTVAVTNSPDTTTPTSVSTVPNTTAPVTTSTCATTDVRWTGYQQLHSRNQTFATGVILPAGTVTRVVIETYDGQSEGATPTRTAQKEPNETVGIAIGGTSVNALTTDLPDTLEEGAKTTNYSGLLSSSLAGWAGVAVSGGQLVLQHSSLYNAAGIGSNSLGVRSVVVTMSACTPKSGGKTVTPVIETVTTKAPLVVTPTSVVNTGKCVSKDYTWSGWETVHSFRPLLATGISIPAPATGQTQTVDSIVVETYDGQSPNAVPTRADQRQPYEQVGVGIGNTTVNALTRDLPDTVAQGALNPNNSGVVRSELTAWKGVRIAGGTVVINHSSKYMPVDPSSSSVSVKSVVITVSTCS